VKVVLSGNGSGAAALPKITLAPASVSFGTVLVGGKSTQTVTVKNDGTANLVLGVATLSTSTSEITLLSGQDLCSGATLVPGQSCTIGIRVKAISQGPKTATLSLTSNDPNQNPATANVTATVQYY
jgi:hypothetical protein